MYTNSCKDAGGQLRVGGAVGVGGDYKERAAALLEAGADALFIDAATGHTTRVMEVVRQLRETYPDEVVVAGNVVTAAGAKDLIDSGATAVKVAWGQARSAPRVLLQVWVFHNLRRSVTWRNMLGSAGWW